MDALPEELRRRPVRKLFTNYVHEALPGSVLSLFAAQQGDAAFVRGNLGEEQSFAVELEYV